MFLDIWRQYCLIPVVNCMCPDKRVRVIIVTDGDSTAQQAVKIAAQELKLYPLILSTLDADRIKGPEITSYILQAPREPVIVMVDDHGIKGTGPGEEIICYLMSQVDKSKILGVVAVASQTRVKGVAVDCSITADGRKIEYLAVDKDGIPIPGEFYLKGDTVEILTRYPEVMVVGCGDPGKMAGFDSLERGAAVTRRCLEYILQGGGKLE